MRLVPIALSLALLSPLVAARPARAGLVRSVVGWQKHNASVDRDERLGLREYLKLGRTGVMPSRVAPAEVLALKVSRAEHALARLRISASESRHRLAGGLVISEAMSGTLSRLNDVNAALYEARRYASSRGLALPDRIRAAAREALDEARWHLDAHPPAAGFSQYGVVVAGARESERMLGEMAAGK